MRIIGLVLFFCIGINVFAQDYKFGEVSKEELEEKSNPLDSSANATYLYKYRKTYFEYQQGEGFSLVTDIHERVKIYDHEGYDYATHLINLYESGGNQEKVNGLKAFTYSLDNGKIVESKLKKDGVFETKTSKYYNQFKFTMPNIAEGVVIEYKYKITSPFWSNVDEFQFQSDIPIKKLEASFEAPEYFSFKMNSKGFLGIAPKMEASRDRITFRSKTRSGLTRLGDGLNKTTFHSEDVEFSKSISKYNLTNIPALKEEPFVNNIDNYRSAVKYELSYTKFPNSTIKHYTTTWDDVIKTIYKSPSYNSELEKIGYFEDDINNLVASVSDPMQRAILIFDFVKSKVKWDGYASKYVDKGVKKAYKENSGNVAEINLMLTAMLRYAGLNANPVLISTRGNGVPLFPTREGYNYVICGIEVPNNVILLDATDKYSTVNVLPEHVLNWEGRIIRKQGSSAQVNLYPKEKSKNTIQFMVSLFENGDLEGNYRSTKTNHQALKYRKKYNNRNEDDFLEELENKYGGLEVSDFKVTNATDLSKPVTESFKFFKENQADVIGDKLYFSPMFYMATQENPFKLEHREFPVDFVYPSSTAYRGLIKIPEGYKVETIPEPKALSLPDNLGAFKCNIVAKGDTIIITMSTDINQPIISSLYYDSLKEYFKQIIEKENEKVVLSKV